MHPVPTTVARPRYWLLMLLPPVIGCLFILLEWRLGHSIEGKSMAGTLSEKTKKIIEMDTDLAKWFITLASGLIGATLYYLRPKAGEQAESSSFSRAVIGGTCTMLALSIFFGHLWLANLRSMVANDTFGAFNEALVWPERLQYFSFIAGLCWFVLLMIERENAAEAVRQEAKKMLHA